MSLTRVLATLLFTAGIYALPRSKSTIEWKSCPALNKQIFEEIGLVGASFDCATLPVPLDYTDPRSEKLHLSLFRINATKEPVLGTVLYNPGGPGGTGAENLPYDGPKLMENMGGQFDMVSFDPRGTGRTIPFNCTLEDGSSLTRRGSEVLISTNLTDRFLHGGWDDAVSRADLCYATNNNTGRFLGTTFVARDMLEIIDSLGEDGMLRYYGWSYGSVLGEYFAAMFPERVDRMLLDGVVDPNIWKLGHRGNYLVDADAAMQAFAEECVANKNNCAIVNATGATNASEIFEWLNMLLEPLAHNVTDSEEGWEVYYATKSYIYSQLYWPSRWPNLAQVIVLASQGNVSADFGDTSASSEVYNHGPDAIDGIRCSDAVFQVSSPEAYLPQVEYQAGVSESFSDIGYEALWTCAAWMMPSKGRYEGNFTAKTKTPILLVNGEYDVTSPIQGAYNASRLFDGSVVLAHSGYGHGIIASPSRCVANYISAYFVNGTLPDPGTHCKLDLGPWEAANATAEIV
ncbi:hypothetical protein LTR10_022947 [Elasticomyces elasticus]|uniref:Peptidase S33 tripeptidyl aminopeptidase-like C-terminal domain-containing protein n=1 Tax=Exophiala sideris TaxID=1016849 RepID=A0ABR0IZ92_9EURO|nr:hypothetical protein LTR10_022947 [Elasticomyces elasticus]KAK5022682.1 hypothetical protein LTS07_009905 [Exophiala sideris]KAK5027654.1 hypothetical protein LTR13_009361 [Exophiala sideris]KAK5052258.1 hypothetical protein LTR69_010020 [Exophiala sideris]KAK5177945.1 hypothetical protein LTR44_009494 [Eurotiomycetes sp. CCFEE 6388]